MNTFNSDSTDGELIAVRDYESDERRMNLAKRESSTAFQSQKIVQPKPQNQKRLKSNPGNLISQTHFLLAPSSNPKAVPTQAKPAKKLKDLSDEESSGYESDQQVLKKKRVIKLKEKKKTEKTQNSVKFKPPKSKFLELEADEGSDSGDSDFERELPRAAKGNQKFNFSHKSF